MTQRRTQQALLQQGLEVRRHRQSDVQHRIYVRPLGATGLHIVKSRPDGAEFMVAGPRRTFRPGQFVPTGRHVGEQGETILIEPPPGKRGTAAPPKSDSAPPLPTIDDSGGAIPVSGTYPGYEAGFSAEGAGFTPSMYLELTEVTNRAGSDVPGFVILLGWTFSDSTLLSVTVTTADSYAATGSSSDPHPGFRIRYYNEVPPAGRLVGTGNRWWFEGV